MKRKDLVRRLSNFFLLFDMENMWATSTPKAIEKKTKTTLPLEKYMANARQSFNKKREEIPMLREEASRLRSLSDTYVQRYQTRLKNDCLKKAKTLEEEAHIRESMQREHAYEQMIGPYVKAYNQKVEMKEVQVTWRMVMQELQEKLVSVKDLVVVEQLILFLEL